MANRAGSFGGFNGPLAISNQTLPGSDDDFGGNRPNIVSLLLTIENKRSSLQQCCETEQLLQQADGQPNHVSRDASDESKRQPASLNSWEARSDHVEQRRDKRK